MNFESNPNVLYISLHRYDNGLYYPGKSGDMNNIGLGQAKGRNINIPWSMGSSSHLIGSDEYVYVFDKLLYPVC